MANSRMLTFRADEDVDEQLNQLSEATDRPKSWHIQRAVDEYLGVQSWQIEEINKGLEDVKTGRLVNHDTVGEWLKSWGTAHEKDAPL